MSAAFFGALLVRPADVMYVYHPPPTIALAAVVLKALRGIPFVYDVQDLWPDTLEATGMVQHKALLKCVDLWCRATYALSDRVVVLSQGFKRKLQERWVGDKIDIILNWADETLLGVMDQESARAKEPQMAGRFNVVFAGTMGKAQALEAVLDAAALVAPMMPHLAEEIYARLYPGSDGIVAELRWPEADAGLAAAESVTIAVQVLGKLRGTIALPPGSAEEDVLAAAAAETNVARLLEGKRIVKRVYVPNRIVNFVIAG